MQVALNVESKGSIALRSEGRGAGLAVNISIGILATMLNARCMDRLRQVASKFSSISSVAVARRTVIAVVFPRLALALSSKWPLLLVVDVHASSIFPAQFCPKFALILVLVVLYRALSGLS